MKKSVRQPGWDLLPNAGVNTYHPDSLIFQVSHVDIETEKRLRKDLKRTKALLADAQIMLDHMKNNAPSKREIAQLKNQVLTASTILEIIEETH